MNQSDPTAPSGPPIPDAPPDDAPIEINAPLPAGTNVIGKVGVDGSIPVGANYIGQVGLNGALPAGNNNIGDVDVASLPPLPAGTNNIGDVDVVSSALPAGAATEATLATRLGAADVSIKAAATAAVVGDKALVVAQSPNSPTPAGSNHIGGVTVDAITPDALDGAAPDSDSVGIASATALAANVNRRGLVVTNLSGNTISLAFGANPAVLGQGISLVAGAMWEMTPMTFSREAIQAIASGAGSALSIQEFE